MPKAETWRCGWCGTPTPYRRWHRALCAVGRDWGLRLADQLLIGLGLIVAPMTEPTGAVRDFTIKREPIRFRIEPDEFAAPAFLNPIAMRKMAKMAGELQPMMANLTEENFDHTMRQVADLFRVLIPGKHGERFAERLNSETEPIDLMQEAIPVLYFLMEQWGLRPTTLSATSSDGSTTETTPSADTSSTDGASAEASSNENSTTPPTG